MAVDTPAAPREGPVMSRLTFEELLPYCAVHRCQPPWDGVSPWEDVVCSGARSLDEYEYEYDEDEDEEAGDEEAGDDDEDEEAGDDDEAAAKAAARALHELECDCGCDDSSPYQPPENFQYEDLRSMRSLHHVREAQEIEAELDTLVGTLDGPALCEYTRDHHPFFGLDPFVASTVMALVFAGAVPISSCCGWPDHYMANPLVAFWCPPEALPRIHAAACQADVWLYGEGDPDRNPYDPTSLVVAHEHDVHALRRFAAALTELVLAEAPPATGEG